MGEVATVNTPKSVEALREALRGRDLSTKQRCFLLAHIRIENANGGGIFNNNIGNLSIRDTSDKPFWRPPWFEPAPDASEITLRRHEEMLQNRAPRAFRAFATFESGLQTYLDRLRQGFPSMLAARSAAEFVQAWRDSGYTPGLNVRRTLQTFRALLAEDPECKASSVSRSRGILAPLVFAGGVLGAAYLSSRARR